MSPAGARTAEPTAPGAPESRRPSDLAIETFARGFFREAERYGFQQRDYLRFMSRLLDVSMQRPARDGGALPSPGDEASVEVAGGLPLSDGTVCVRAFRREEDLPVFRSWMDDPVGRYFLLSRTVSRARTLEEIVDDPASVVGVVTLPDGTPIGSTAFLHMDVDHHKAELRKLIGEPAARRMGYAKAATRLWIAYGLQALGLRKIYLDTVDTNLRNVRLNEDLGFRVEGILRSEICVDGRTHDVLRMALLRE